MVDINKKDIQFREAIATGEIRLRTDTVKRIKDERVKKGNPIQIAIIAGIQGAKLTPMIIPLCHPIPIENTEIKFEILDYGLRATAKVSSTSKTGVEMEALAAVSTALLNIWDVVKMYEKDKDGQYPETSIDNIVVIKKVKR
jgi:cyclic pyranopterin phosphate synthase